MQEDASLVLFELRGHFAEGQDHCRWLGLRQGGMLQSLRAQSVMQAIGRTGEEESCSVGQDRRGRCPVTTEGTLHRFDRTVAIAPCAIEDFIHLLWRGGLQRGAHKARVVTHRHDCRFAEDPPRLGPGRGGRGERLIEAAPDGRALALRPCQCSPLLGQCAGLLQEGSGVAK